jgi:hypothetical protein
LRFKPETRKPNGEVSGPFRLDRKYDGVRKTRPEGVIYIVTGGGGATLQDPDREDQETQWQDYSAHLDTHEHSFTFVEADRHALRFRQIGEDGKGLDRFVVTR